MSIEFKLAIGVVGVGVIADLVRRAVVIKRRARRMRHLRSERPIRPYHDDGEEDE